MSRFARTATLLLLPSLLLPSRGVALPVDADEDAAIANAPASVGRWLVASATWGTLSWTSDDGRLEATVVSYASRNGRIVLAWDDAPKSSTNTTFASLTLSEAQVGAARGGTCGADGLDPEDPRCAKATVDGPVRALAADDAEWERLWSAAHPRASTATSSVALRELVVERAWILSDYGGGADVSSDAWRRARVQRRRPATTTTATSRDANETTTTGGGDVSSLVARARRLVARGRWATATTNASGRAAHRRVVAWGNVRSTHDHDGNGLPVFYLPTPDPTHVDVERDDSVVLTFTEAALGDDDDDVDPRDRFRATLRGRARRLFDDELAAAERGFAATHPRAPWLAEGGAHTGGDYYTIDLERVEATTSGHGVVVLDADDYLGWTAATKDEERAVAPPSAATRDNDERSSSSNSFAWGCLLGLALSVPVATGALYCALVHLRRRRHPGDDDPTNEGDDVVAEDDLDSSSSLATPLVPSSLDPSSHNGGAVEVVRSKVRPSPPSPNN